MKCFTKIIDVNFELSFTAALYGYERDFTSKVAPGWRRLVSSPKRLHGCFGPGIGIESRTRCHFRGVLLLVRKAVRSLIMASFLIIDFSWS
jgi:hypothetical protein